MVKLRGHLFVRRGQRDPELSHVEPGAALPQLARRSFRMGNAAPRGHPIHRARTNGLLEAQTVAVDDLTLDHVRDRGQPDVRVRAHIQATARRKVARSQVIEKAKRPQVLARRRRQDP